MAQATKIMLVEDDNNLGEIYMARMAAEGYSVVVAHDGEEALALAAKEKPDLIISDVMMPKISGFEMLDILRNTPGLRDTKVIMLTALGQAEDKTRAQSLGADRYLVKSQVTLEDIVENARALLSGEASGATATPLPAGSQPAMVQPTQTAQPAAPTTPASTTIPVPAATPIPEGIPLATPPTDQTAPAAPVMPGVTAPAADPPAAADRPAPAPDTPVAANPAPTPTEGLAQPLNAGPESKESKKTVPIESLIADPTPPPPQPLQMPAPTVTSALPLAEQPVQAAPPQPPAPEPPKPPEPPPTTNIAANDKILTGAVDELLSNAPKPPGPSTEPIQTAVPSAPNPVLENKPSEHTEKVLDDGGNDLAAGDTDSSRVAHKKVIAPIGDYNKKPDLNALLANEEAKQAGSESNPNNSGITTSAGGLQTTVVVPSTPGISDITPPPSPSQSGNLTASQTPGQNNPNTMPSTANTPGANFDPNSVAL